MCTNCLLQSCIDSLSTVKCIFTINLYRQVLWRGGWSATNQALWLLLIIYLSTALRMWAIQEFLSSLELVWISYISGPFKEALIKNIAFSSLATSLTINFCNEITGGLESCKRKYEMYCTTLYNSLECVLLSSLLFSYLYRATMSYNTATPNFTTMASSHDTFDTCLFFFI